jgi:uncharacterized protein YjiK
MPTDPLLNPSARRPSRFGLRWYYWLLLLVVLLYGLVIAMHWDDRGALWVLERFESKKEQGESVWLPDYTAVIDAKALPGMEKDEASDLAYSPLTKTLFSVMGKNPFLVELTLEGDVLRKIPLDGWSNPEGLTVMENGLLAIVDERNHVLTVVKIDANTQRLNRADFPNTTLGFRRTRIRPLKPSPGTRAASNCCWERNAPRRCSSGRVMAVRCSPGRSKKCPVMNWTCATCRP